MAMVSRRKIYILLIVVVLTLMLVVYLPIRSNSVQPIHELLAKLQGGTGSIHDVPAVLANLPAPASMMTRVIPSDTESLNTSVMHHVSNPWERITENWQYVHEYDIATGNRETNITKPWKCVDLRAAGMVSPICIYNPNIDMYVSGSISQHGSWEGDLIQHVVGLLSRNSNMQFLDIGCNIGVYTISVAKYGRKVLAIDANRRNLRLLSRSLTLGGLQKNVTLLWNAIADKIQNVSLQDGAKNVGGTRVKPLNSANNVDDDHKAVAITLDDLTERFKNVPLVIKMDIESYEWLALQGAVRFFRDVDIKYILLEWMHHKMQPTGILIYQYLTQRNFVPFHPRSLVKLEPYTGKSKAQWPNDIFWVHE